MNNKRLTTLYQSIEESDLDYVLISDPISIAYLLDIMIYPGERFLGLLLSRDREANVILNRLFHLDKDIAINKEWYFDTDDSMKLVASFIKKEKANIGVDKILPSKFLLPLMQYLPNAIFTNGSFLIDAIRMIKDEDEIRIMKQASMINDSAMDDVIKLVVEGVKEIEVANKLPSIYKSYNGDGNSFEPIIAFGSNGADGHHSCDDTIIKQGDSVVIDMGCVYQGYCSDMTRTVFYKEASLKAVEVYELVKKANEAAIAMIKPGVRLCDIDKCARDIIEEGGYGENFNHRLGHFIGKEVHEYGDVSSQFTLEVKEGMIFSIEPGIYIEGELGVRIEDLVLVTKEGCSVLNKYSKDLKIIK